jgi:hypothetical protein
MIGCDSGCGAGTGRTARAWSLKLKGSKLQWIDGEGERRTAALH